jgi:outer membrane lipoprotein-sorting protein
MSASSARLALRARVIVALAALSVPSAVCAQQSAPAPTAPAKLPPAREIIDHYVRAIGGRAAVADHTSTRQTGSFSVPASGLSGRIEILAAAPNRHLLRIEFPGFGTQVTVFDGMNGWSIDPASGPRLLEGKELAYQQENSDFQEALHDSTRFASIETVALTDFEGRPCYKLKLVRKSGDQYFELYDAKTGLLAGQIATVQTAMGAIEATNVMSDYKSFSGVMIPTTIVQRAQQQEFRIAFDSVQFDSVPASAFDPPEAIKTLLSAPAKPDSAH